MPKRDNPELTTRYADMLSAMGTEARLRIMRLLLSAHPDGMVAGEIGGKLDIPSSTFPIIWKKLKNEDLVRVRREGTYLSLWPSSVPVKSSSDLGSGGGSDVLLSASSVTPRYRRPL